MVRAGTLRHRLTAFKPNASITFDDHGQTVEGTTQVHQMWGSVEPLRGQEALLARQLNETVTHRVMVRYSTEIAGINAQWHFTFGSRTLCVAEVLNIDERKKELECLCAEEP